MSPAAEIAKLIADAGLGALGTGTWPINTAVEPAEPANCITIYDEGGGLWEPDINAYSESIRVRVRSIDYQTGYAKMFDIFDFLEKDNFCHSGASSNFVGIFSSSSITALGRDDNDRFLFAQIFTTQRERK
jgi:hypothetical protein